MYYKGLYLSEFSRESKSGVFDSPVTITVHSFCPYLIKMNYMYMYMYMERGREGRMDGERQRDRD